MTKDASLDPLNVNETGIPADTLRLASMSDLIHTPFPRKRSACSFSRLQLLSYKELESAGKTGLLPPPTDWGGDCNARTLGGGGRLLKADMCWKGTAKV